MPQKGEVDFIYGGPPCQGFSDMNRFKKDDDIRNTLVATFLSYVDFYQPDYVLLENVKGLLGHKFGDIKMGIVKLIFRSLTCMGYQVRMDLLQAGQYGVPQTRRRIIFWGAKLGVEMPLCPQPTHCFPKKNGAITLPNRRTLTNSIKRSSAAYPAVVVGDVITDLPGYEYVNPHHVYPATVQSQAENASRPWTKYDTALSRSRKEDYVGAKKQAYRYPPLTEYQRSLREGVGKDDLTGHYTRIFDIQTTERICSIGLGAGSDHRSLPANLKPWCLSHLNSKAISNGMYPGLYGRLDPDGIFKTAVTAIRPCGKTGVSYSLINSLLCFRMIVFGSFDEPFINFKTLLHTDHTSSHTTPCNQRAGTRKVPRVPRLLQVSQFQGQYYGTAQTDRECSADPARGGVREGVEERGG